MESREKCEQIIQIFNGTQLSGAKDPLLVKFADGGSKKKNAFKNQNDPNTRTWREVTEVIIQSIVLFVSLFKKIMVCVNDLFISPFLFEFELDNAGNSSCI